MRYGFLREVDPPLPLAVEESLLDLAESSMAAGEATEDLILFWEPKEYFVVVGYANRVSAEVNLGACKRAGVPVYRRLSGGGTVLQGPGCLNYALILRIEENGPTMSISSTNTYCMERIRRAIAGLINSDVRIEGFTDLALGGRKFSGNAQRRRRESLVFHGCFLREMNLNEIEKCLLMPGKQPAYRGSRSHRDFLMNLQIPADVLISALISEWNAMKEMAELPLGRARELLKTKYEDAEWNMKF